MLDGDRETGRKLTVMVTGGTGFVGFHTVLSLVEAGHSVRLLVRSREKLRRVYAPYGLAELPFVEGDITDRASVERALDGCDAVVHSAAMVGGQARDSDRVLHNNLRGTEHVLGGAHRHGIERLIQVSSTTALFRPGAARVDESSPLGTVPSGYGRSKLECEKYVRQLQASGAPIVTTYPGTVIGPYDPGLSEGMHGLKLLLDAGFLAETSGGIQTIDVRDVARAHVMLLERGGPPDRFLMGGTYLDWPAYGDLLERVTGRPWRRLYVPPTLFRLLASAAEVVSGLASIETPMTAENAGYATQWARTDDGHLLHSLGFEYRDLHETLYDAIAWLQESGHVSAGYRLEKPAPRPAES